MFAEENKQDQQDPVLEGEAADETYWRGEMTKWLMEEDKEEEPVGCSSCLSQLLKRSDASRLLSILFGPLALVFLL